MIENNTKLEAKFEQGMKEFDTAATLLTDALQAFHQRLERIEQWILHQGNRKAKWTKTPTTDTVKQ